MSDSNRLDGFNCYQGGNQESRSWFERQWSIWPQRADERFTTNLSFHWGGVIAFREQFGREPNMSKRLAENIGWLDRNAIRE